MASVANETAQTSVTAALRQLDLVSGDEQPVFTPLTGGVSSDIWRVDLPGRPSFCVKRAAPRLRVAADWRVPVERNAFEAAWLRRAEEAVPGMAPRLLGQDHAAGLLAMEYLSPRDHPVWKTQLLAGQAEITTAAAVADRLVKLHAATANQKDVADEFASDRIFWTIRLEPYLIATAAAQPKHARRLQELADTTAANKIALVHGDVSPKNILIGPSGPILVDAECAWFGDPAFDLAFCLNHLLLKCLPSPAAKEDLLACFAGMATTYLAGVTWEQPSDLERRAARLLPGLTLARIDGKSPVEYITDPAEKDLVRHVAGRLLEEPADRLKDIKERWGEALRRA